MYKLNAAPAPRLTVNLRTILERIADVEPRSFPGAAPPVSAYAFPAYCGSAEINTEMLFNVLTWINSNCDTLDAGEKGYIASIIATIDAARTAQRAAIAAATRHVAARGRGISAFAVVSSGRGSAAAQVSTSARGGCGVAVASAGGSCVAVAAASSGSGRAVAVASGGRGACARSGARIIRRGR